MKNKKKRWVVPAILATALAAALVWIISDKQPAEEVHGKNIAEMMEDSRPASITYQGKTYQAKDHIKSYLFLGIDRTGEVATTGNLFAGQSDTMIVLVVDEDNRSYTPLLLDRDTVTTVDILDDTGEIAYSASMQICLAHAYGSGKEDSCKNAVRAVSHLLYDMPIDSYLSLHMDAIPLLNNAIGGVTVTIEDDFSQEDPSLLLGESVTLTDEQAYHYLRGRMTVGNGENSGRMRRQQTYAEAAIAELRSQGKDSSEFILSLYQTLDPYMVSGLSGEDVNTLAQVLAQYKNSGFCTIAGESRVVDGYMEFHADETSLRETVLSLYYKEQPAA